MLSGTVPNIMTVVAIVKQAERRHIDLIRAAFNDRRRNRCPKNLLHQNLLLPYQTVQLKKASVTTEGQTLLWYACKLTFIVAGLGLRLNGIEVRVRPLPRRKMPSDR